MAFCINCGQELAAGAKFCANCGKVVNNNDSTTQRKTVYDGEIHKCPNCGGIVNAFETTCTSCGHEIRGAKASGSVRELAEKLEQIEAARQEETETSGKNYFNQLLSNNHLSKTEEQKVNLISNFPIPNTREDLFEFLVLASSNINEKRYGFDGISLGAEAISDAWETKFDQAYQKAKISFGDSFEFEKIDVLNTAKETKIARSKKRKTRIVTAFVCGLVLFFAIMLGDLLIFDDIKIRKENDRLNAIVEEVYEHIESEEYLLARSKASTLVFSGSTTLSGEQAAEKWDETRRELLDVIDIAEGKSEHSYTEPDKALSDKIKDWFESAGIS